MAQSDHLLLCWWRCWSVQVQVHTWRGQLDLSLWSWRQGESHNLVRSWGRNECDSKSVWLISGPKKSCEFDWDFSGSCGSHRIAVQSSLWTKWWAWDSRSPVARSYYALLSTLLSPSLSHCSLPRPDLTTLQTVPLFISLSCALHAAYLSLDCYDETKGTQDQDFSCSFSDSL